MRHRVLGVIASMVVAGLGSARGGVITVSGPYSGAAGTGSSSYQTSYYGNTGGDGYDTTSSSTYQFSNATITGGTGASITGTDNAANLTNTYYAGSGGSAVDLVSAGTFSSGTYRGGNGGTVSGNGLQTNGGFGGDALIVAPSQGSVLASITGGTFTGGNAGSNSATTATTRDGGGGGDAVFVFTNATLSISGGTFAGGNADPASNLFSTGVPGNGVTSYNGSTVNIYGGTFTGGPPAGTFGFTGEGVYANQGTVNIYGSNFEVNGIPVGSGPITNTYPYGTLTGTLEDNSSPSSIVFSNGSNGGTVNLIEISVPEPASFGLLSGIAIFGLARRRGPSGK